MISLRSRLAAVAPLLTTGCSLPGWLAAPFAFRGEERQTKVTSLLAEAQAGLAESPADAERLVPADR